MTFRFVCLLICCSVEGVDVGIEWEMEMFKKTGRQAGRHVASCLNLNISLVMWAGEGQLKIDIKKLF